MLPMTSSQLKPDQVTVDAPALSAGRPRAARILVVAAVVLLVAELAARVIGPSLPTPLVFYDAVAQVKDSQLKRIARTGGAELVITGPSSTLFGVDPVALGQRAGATAYNAGIAAGVPPITVDWLERFVLPRAHPRTVVWVLSTYDLNDGRRTTEVKRYFESLAARDDAWARLDRRASRVSALVRYRGELRSPKSWRDALANKPGEVKLWRSRLTPLGLATYQNLPLNERSRHQVLELVGGFRVGRVNAGVVRREIRRMQARGIRVVLAEAPLPERAIALHPHGQSDVTAFEGELRVIADTTGAPWVPLPAELRVDSLYQDYTHLNREGAARYTELIGSALG